MHNCSEPCHWINRERFRVLCLRSAFSLFCFTYSFCFLFVSFLSSDKIRPKDSRRANNSSRLSFDSSIVRRMLSWLYMYARCLIPAVLFVDYGLSEQFGAPPPPSESVSKAAIIFEFRCDWKKKELCAN